MAYFGDLDPVVKLELPLTLTFRVEDTGTDEGTGTNEDTATDFDSVEILQSLTLEAPVSVSTIAPLYRVDFNETLFFPFDFADVQALKGMVDQSELGGLKIRIVENSLSGALSLSELEFSEVGFGKLVIRADGVAASEELLPQPGQLESSNDTEDSEMAITTHVKVEVTDLSPGGLTSTFLINFEFMHLPSDEQD